MTILEKRKAKLERSPFRDPQAEAHIKKMERLKAEHRGRDCICEPNSPCDYHLATAHWSTS